MAAYDADPQDDVALSLILSTLRAPHRVHGGAVDCASVGGMTGHLPANYRPVIAAGVEGRAKFVNQSRASEGGEETLVCVPGASLRDEIYRVLVRDVRRACELGAVAPNLAHVSRGRPREPHA